MFNNGMHSGVLFVHRRLQSIDLPVLANMSSEGIGNEVASRFLARETEQNRSLSRKERLSIARSVWWEAGALKEDLIRNQFMAITKSIGMPATTAPKLLRHQFATALQDANVDPLIRNQLMGHSPVDGKRFTTSLGMTGLYTHTKVATARAQLEQAMSIHAAVHTAKGWIAIHGG